MGNLRILKIIRSFKTVIRLKKTYFVNKNPFKKSLLDRQTWSFLYEYIIYHEVYITISALDQWVAL